MSKETIQQVQEKLDDYQKTGLAFPINYNPVNALKMAWLELQDVKDKSGVCVLKSCTPVSIQKALLKMAIQGLSVAKNQGYFIAYGKELIFQKSYFGTKLICERLPEVKKVTVPLIIWKNDVYETEIKDGSKYVSKHVQSLKNITGKLEDVVGAYCYVILNDGTKHLEEMTMHQIKSSWDQGFGTGKTHKKFPDQMIKKTVIARASKYFVNSSDDSDLQAGFFSEEKPVFENENGKPVIDVQDEIEAESGKETFDNETGEVVEDDMPDVFDM